MLLVLCDKCRSNTNATHVILTQINKYRYSRQQQGPILTEQKWVENYNYQPQGNDEEVFHVCSDCKAQQVVEQQLKMLKTTPSAIKNLLGRGEQPPKIEIGELLPHLDEETETELRSDITDNTIEAEYNDVEDVQK